MSITAEQVLDAIGASAYGLSIAELEGIFPDVNRRTIQRRVATLVATEKVSRDGSGPQRRYRLSDDPSEDAEPSGDAPPGVLSAQQVLDEAAERAPKIPRGLIDNVKFSHEQEKVRKLRLQNDETEGLLVPAEEVKAEVAARYAALQSGLEALPARLKMRRPDLSAEDMAALHDEIAQLSRSLRGFTMPDPEDDAVAAG